MSGRNRTTWYKNGREKIALICGWRKSTYGQEGKDYAQEFPVWVSPVGRLYDAHPSNSCLPEYFSDLNAMWEAERHAPAGYADEVRYIVATDARVQPAHLCDQYLIMATADQRARAFLRAHMCDGGPQPKVHQL